MSESVALILILPALIAGGVWWLFGWRAYAKKRVLLNLKSGSAFQGVLWKRTGPLLVLRDASLADGSKIDGEVVVERRDIDFLQVL